MSRQARLAASVVNDPQRSSSGQICCKATTGYLLKIWVLGFSTRGFWDRDPIDAALDLERRSWSAVVYCNLAIDSGMRTGGSQTQREFAMQLCRNAKLFLDMVAASGQPKLWELTPIEARQKVIELTHLVECEESIGEIEDRTLPGPAGALPYRVYTPTTARDERTGGVIFFHGGAWVLGNLDTHDCLCRILANESGCRFVSVDYRLAPEHPFPAAVEDACAATAWIAAHATELNIDPNCLAVAGDSAGGTLAAVVCQGAKGLGCKIALQVLLCPVTDIAADNQSRREFAEGYFLEGPLMSWAGTHYLPSDVDPNDPRLSPLRAPNLSGLPPCHIHTAGFDLLRDEGKAYADALERAGVNVRHVCHEQMIHHFYAMAGAIPYARTALEAVGADIKAALRVVKPLSMA